MSEVRANLMNDHHAFVTPGIFFIEEEVRKVAASNANKRMLTFQECNNAFRLESVTEALVTEELMFVKPLYQRDPQYFS